MPRMSTVMNSKGSTVTGIIFAACNALTPFPIKAMDITKRRALVPVKKGFNDSFTPATRTSTYSATSAAAPIPSPS
ncbi:MAG: hypothetical protein LBG24_02005 [Treponema sp.]|nr:hypothetical protein [Treponema sp.]